MHHHASRLLTAIAPVTAPFSSILQAAAARAWTRRAYTINARQIDKKKRKPTPYIDITHNTTTNSLRDPDIPTQLVGVHPMDPDALSEYDITWRDPARADDIQQPDPPWVSEVLAISRPADTLPLSHVPVPTSSKSLYQNLLRIISSGPFSISSVLNYHFAFPRAYWSTRSFNLLISLAIQRTAFGTAGRLLTSMRSEVVPANMETWKLTVRWLVRTGRWSEAWHRVLQITEGKRFQSGTSDHRMMPIPFPLWLELFGSPPRGALRYRGGASAPGPPFRTFLGSSTVLSPSPSQRQPTVAQLQMRYRALMQSLPPLTSLDYPHFRPRAALICARAIIQLGHSDEALSMTLSYLKTLPERPSRSDRLAVVDLLHLHMSSVRAKRGLSRHFAQRRVLYRLLGAHSSLRPSPATLFLLLGSLRACRKSGTLAVHYLKIFRKRWGPRMQSSMVSRRIAQLALKEGRLDIAKEMITAQKMEKKLRASWRWKQEVLGRSFPRSLSIGRRRSWHTIYCGRGAENRRWHLLIKKLRQRQRGLKHRH